MKKSRKHVPSAREIELAEAARVQAAFDAAMAADPVTGRMILELALPALMDEAYRLDRERAERKVAQFMENVQWNLDHGSYDTTASTRKDILRKMQYLSRSVNDEIARLEADPTIAPYSGNFGRNGAEIDELINTLRTQAENESRVKYFMKLVSDHTGIKPVLNDENKPTGEFKKQ